LKDTSTGHEDIGGGSGGGSGGGGGARGLEVGEGGMGGGHEHAAVFVCVDGLVIGVVGVSACVVLFVVYVCRHGTEAGARESELWGVRFGGVIEKRWVLRSDGGRGDGGEGWVWRRGVAVG
jgi:hypothetical protein